MSFPKSLAVTWLLFLAVTLYPFTSSAWFDETHLSIAKVAGYEKWFNAADPDVAKLKLGAKKSHNQLPEPARMPHHGLSSLSGFWGLLFLAKHNLAPLVRVFFQ